MTASNQLINIPKPTEDNLFLALKETTYPGAKDISIMMVLHYCKARNLNPLLKPVHLVPMYVKTGKVDSSGKDIKEWRDVPMPGIGQYRIDAARSNMYAGMDEPLYGPNITEKLGGISVTYPEWCKITVYKKLGDSIVAFTAKEYWKENYATVKKDEIAPNAMWKKRPYGQLAKCTEAQALRKAFPDVVSQEPTAEEMEGKHFMKDVTPENTVKKIEEPKDAESEFNNLLANINNCESMEQLQEVFNGIKKLNFKSNPDLFKKLIDAKDAKKNELLDKHIVDSESKVDESTGEIK